MFLSFVVYPYDGHNTPIFSETLNVSQTDFLHLKFTAILYHGCA